MVEVQTLRDIFAQGEKSIGLKSNEKFLILRPCQKPGSQESFIVRSIRVCGRILIWKVINSSVQGIEGEVSKRNVGNLELPSWFQIVDRRAAENQLSRMVEGRFIVRPTTHGGDSDYSVSVKYKRPGDVHHFKLAYSAASRSWSMWGQNFKSLQDISYYSLRNAVNSWPHQHSATLIRYITT